MLERFTNLLWRVFDIDLGWWVFMVLAILYAIGLSDPTCCMPNVFDDGGVVDQW